MGIQKQEELDAIEGLRARRINLEAIARQESTEALRRRQQQEIEAVASPDHDDGPHNQNMVRPDKMQDNLRRTLDAVEQVSDVVSLMQSLGTGMPIETGIQEADDSPSQLNQKKLVTDALSIANALARNTTQGGFWKNLPAVESKPATRSASTPGT